jgi:predicted glycoside hydrolase/deacetylase ChbG (UPF0249 family)
MIIINADDLGRSRNETDAALACHRQGRIASATAMVFMEDSERAADLAMAQGLDVGLHLNLDQDYNGRRPAVAAVCAHRRVVRFLSSNKFARLLYNPLLRQHFREVVQSQIDEFVRLYAKAPSHIDGHHHQHLCTNMVIDELLPERTRIRRNFSYEPGEKSFLNRYYRGWVDRRLARRHRLTDYFFSLADCLRNHQLPRVFGLAKTANVELMTHPREAAECEWLMSNDFLSFTQGLEMRSYASV